MIAAGQSSHGDRAQVAGGTYLGQATLDAQGRHAEIAAAGQALVDARKPRADGGTNPRNLGPGPDDARWFVAEIAAAGRTWVDARMSLADGGTYPEHLGRLDSDAQATGAEIAAAGQTSIDDRRIYADGGTYSEHLGQTRGDAQSTSVEIAAVGHSTPDTRSEHADGGTNMGHAMTTPQADHIGIFTDDDEDYLHVVLMDDADKPIAVAILSLQQASDVLANLSIGIAKLLHRNDAPGVQ
jgi:hypothetical protein